VRRIQTWLFVWAIALPVGRAQTPEGSPGSYAGLQVCTATLATLADRIYYNRFAYRRNLMEYQSTFGGEFWMSLMRLKPADQWLDAGSGAGIALSEYQVGKPLSDILNSTPPFPLESAFPVTRSRTLGVVVQLPPAAAEFSAKVSEAGAANRHRILEGRRIEDIPAGELGKAKLITDFFGPVTYSTALDRVLNKYLEIGHPDAEIFLKFAGGKITVQTKEGERLELQDYLVKRMVGHRVVIADPITRTMLHIKLDPAGVKSLPKLRLDDIEGEGVPTFYYVEE